MTAKTVKIESVPTGHLILISAIDALAWDEPKRGSVHKTAEQGRIVYLVRVEDEIGEHLPATQITYAMAPLCRKCGDAPRQRPGGTIRCMTCYKARQAEIKSGEPSKARARKAQTPEEALIAADDLAQRLAEARARFAASQAPWAPILRAVLAGAPMRASKAKRAAYARARATALVAEWGVEIADAARLAEVEPWEPMTWAEYRAAFPRREDEEAIAA